MKHHYSEANRDYFRALERAEAFEKLTDHRSPFDVQHEAFSTQSTAMHRARIADFELALFYVKVWFVVTFLAFGCLGYYYWKRGDFATTKTSKPNEKSENGSAKLDMLTELKAAKDKADNRRDILNV